MPRREPQASLPSRCFSVSVLNPANSVRFQLSVVGQELLKSVSVSVPQPSATYSRTSVRRLLGVSEAQLKSWERQKLVMTSETYGFRELLALRSLIQLRKDRVAPSKIRSAIHALVRKLAGITDPLTQLKMYAYLKPNSLREITSL